MSTGSSWRRHIRCGGRLCRYGCPRNSWLIWVKQWLNNKTLWPAGAVLRTTFMQCLIAFYSRSEATSEVISDRQICEASCPRQRCEIGDPRLYLFREIPPEAVGSGIFDRLLNFDNCQPEVDSDVISGVVIKPVKGSDSRSNRSRDIRVPHFVTNDDDDTGVRPSSHKGKTPLSTSPQCCSLKLIVSVLVSPRIAPVRDHAQPGFEFVHNLVV